MGFDNGDGINYYSVNGSQTPAIVDIGTTSNIDVIGKYMFRISSTNITDPGTKPLLIRDDMLCFLMSF